MHRLWDTVVSAVLEALRPTVMVEVGTARGDQAERLLEFAQGVGAVVHLVDPDPELNPGEWERRYGDRLVIHTGRSLEALPEIADPDVVLIDGDHNWYTVINELRMLESGATRSGRVTPLVLAHDVGWPYGRRDLYYDPEAIPAEHRQPHDRLGLLPGSVQPVAAGGLNRHLDNALYEGNPRNGVLTAIEDFVSESSRRYELTVVPGVFGVGILAQPELLERNPTLARKIAAFSRAPFLRRQLELLEDLRIELAVRLEDANAARTAVEEAAAVLKQRQRTAERRAVELESAADAADETRAEAGRLAEERNSARGEAAELRERVGELLEELELATGSLRRARAQAKSSAAREGKLAGRLEALRAELTSGRALAADGAAPGGDEPRLRRAFAERYSEVARAIEDAGEGPVGPVLTLDGFGVLAPAAEPGPAGLSVDVVICVHDAPDDVRRCLRSLLAAGGHPFHLILVDDGSALPTRRLLEWFAGEHPNVELIANPHRPHGYTIAANIGLRASSADLVILLNSDTIVTAGWLDALVELAASDERIGVLGPLSNAATQQSVPAVKDDAGWALNPLPDWLTPEAVGLLVARLSDRRTPRAPFVNGFCLGVTREAIERVGEFDEKSFAEGFCEENDYAVRAGESGFILAVSDRAYVHHAKSRSYGSERRERVSREHYGRFLEKHGEERIESLLGRFEETERGLAPLRDRLAAPFSGPEALERTVAGLRVRPLRIDFVLPGMARGGGGGTHSVFQEARALQGLGARARVLLPQGALERASAVYPAARSVFLGFADDRELVELTADTEVIAATHHRSVRLIEAIRRVRSDFLAAYYVQDYEPFFAPSGTEASDEALLSYDTLPGRLVFVKTDWLASVLAVRHGIQAAKVEPSIDTALYHAEGRARPDHGRPLRVAAMVRPRTPRRQPLTTLRALERATAELDDVEAVTFGCSDHELRALCGGEPRGVEHFGVLRRERVAELLRSTDVFVDLSVYQAFGRTGLEAMACGATAVLPAIGGAREYAEDGVNALLAETDDPEGCFTALADLLGDRDRLAGMQEEATATAGRYSALRAALSEYVVCEAALGRAASGETDPVGASR